MYVTEREELGVPIITPIQWNWVSHIMACGNPVSLQKWQNSAFKRGGDVLYNNRNDLRYGANKFAVDPWKLAKYLQHM